MVTVLIIEDNAEVRMLLTLLLQRLSCQAQGARNGVEGQRMALELCPDLILLDAMMDRQDGYQTCTNLRQQGYTGRIVMLSAVRSEEGKPHAIQCGADDYVEKPVTMKVLERQLDALGVQDDSQLG